MFMIVLVGGGTRNRTEGQGFAIQCISHFAMPPKKERNYIFPFLNKVDKSHQDHSSV